MPEEAADDSLACNKSRWDNPHAMQQAQRKPLDASLVKTYLPQRRLPEVMASY
jgi:hypothetical protein